MPANGVYVICQGLVKQGKYTPDRSRRRVLSVLGAGDILGLETLFCQDPCFFSGFAKALEDTKVVFIEKRSFLGFLERHPEVFPQLCARLSREILLYRCKLAELSSEPIRVKLARLLLTLLAASGLKGRTG